MTEVVVRPRLESDLPALLSILRRSHATHGYPRRSEVVRADWLATPTELVGLVAEHAGRVVGHVALHPAAHGPDDDPGELQAAHRWSAATGVRVEDLAVVSRLVTDGTVRGAGRALMDAAGRSAARSALSPVLLVDPAADARAFYRRLGWQEIGTARQRWGENEVDAVLMVVGRP
ncbi:Acetyltransferase (GNAT) domain-containing protein [Klenkia soli]|uniref:Acetyltransferase (GNAT) domain-containing protein n=1 Tax=Klenkia soli TaxID=1052260 RepID=A0A1H0GIA2_9ACTN|nr:GNAT family N-acetyltransferase [Klenkia soli]SDO06636.1 Acetyltransferase (GNAT) domain-containing protein [Klenkia soli]